MKKLLMFCSLTLLILAFQAKSFAAPLVVVVHIENPTTQLSKRQLIDIYMGKYVAFPNGVKAQPIDGPSDSRTVFYKSLVGWSLPQINSYWSRVRFTGRATPPISYNSVSYIQEYLSTNKWAIAYIYDDDVTENMKVVYRIE